MPITINILLAQPAFSLWCQHYIRVMEKWSTRRCQTTRHMMLNFWSRYTQIMWFLFSATPHDLVFLLYGYINSRRPLILMMTPICPRLLNLINYFVLLRFWARAPEDLSAIEVIFYYFYYYLIDIAHNTIGLGICDICQGNQANL